MVRKKNNLFIVGLILTFLTISTVACGVKTEESNGDNSQNLSSEQIDTTGKGEVAVKSIVDETINIENVENMTFTIADENISKTGITVTMSYDGDRQIQIGQWFMLRKYVNDEWKDLSYIIEEVCFTDEAYIINNDKQYDKYYDWTNIYGELSPGKYMWITKVVDFVEANDYSTKYVAQSFEIK